MKQNIFQFALASLLICVSAQAQVNSGSDGSDGVFSPATNTVINMADHPDGIYQYTSVNISNGVTVTFIPNANNTPVVWLVQSNCIVSGTINVSAQNSSTSLGAAGGPGGYAGGVAGGNGLGPGGGYGSSSAAGGNASFATSGGTWTNYQALAGGIYGNSYMLPLMGGSGGGGANVQGGYIFHGGTYGGGGGGGAILIAASGTIRCNGSILAMGGNGYSFYYNFNDLMLSSGAGSGGAVRLIAQQIQGGGTINTGGGSTTLEKYVPNVWFSYSTGAGSGYIRLDAIMNNFTGSLLGSASSGYQPIIIPASSQGMQLSISSIGGAPVSQLPTGQIITPDALLSAQQNNPIPVVVNCINIPLQTLITVTIKPLNGSPITATGYNDAGTQSSSIATILINFPHGGGLIYATAAASN